MAFKITLRVIILSLLGFLSACGGAGVPGEIDPFAGPFIGDNPPNVSCAAQDRVSLDLNFQINGINVLAQAAKGGAVNFHSNTFLPSACYITQIQLSIPDNVEVTIAPNTIIMFGNASAGISVSGGSIIARGTQAQPIYFTGEGEGLVKNKWAGIRITKRNTLPSVFEFTVIEHAGSGSFLFENAAFSITTSERQESPKGRITFINNVIRHVERNNKIEYAFSAQQFSYFQEFDKNTIYNNRVPPISITFNEAQFIGGNNRFRYREKNSDQIIGNEPNRIVVVKPRTSSVLNTSTSDAAYRQNQVTWKKQEIPYLIKDDLKVAQTTLQIEPGAKLEFEENIGLFLDNNNSALSAIGTAEEPITFTKKTTEFSETATTHWYGIRFTNSISPTNRLDHVIIEFAGSDDNYDANLIVDTNSNVAVTNSTFQNSPFGYGIYLDDTSKFSNFSNNKIRLNQKGAGLVAVPSLRYLDPTTDYDNANVNNYIEVLNPSASVIGGTTIPNINTAYAFKQNFIVKSNLVIDPGVILLFDQNIKMEIQNTLTAIGTVDQPILFSSLWKLNSSFEYFWAGLVFSASSGNLNHAIVEYAGYTNFGLAARTNQAGIKLLDSGLSSSRLQLENSTVRNLDVNTHGIYVEINSNITGNRSSNIISNRICNESTGC